MTQLTQSSVPEKGRKHVEAVDETEITEITLQADGRVYVFGLSRDVLEILQTLDPESTKLQNLLGHLKET